MFHFTQHELEGFLVEDLPFHDLSTDALGIAGAAELSYVTRDPGVTCGTEEVRRLGELLGLSHDDSVASGTRIEPGQTLLTIHGDAAAVFALWKVGQNLLDRSSGIATAARRWRDRLDEAGHGIPVLITRKVLPGAKKLVTKAAVVGGAVPHRLGVSETILFFDQHVAAVGGRQAFLDRLPSVRRAHIEKKILVETVDPDFAAAALEAGADGIQFDKLSPDEVAAQVQTLTAQFENVVLLAAGGVTLENCTRYATAGVHGLVTSAIYQAPPLDVGVRIRAM